LSEDFEAIQMKILKNKLQGCVDVQYTIYEILRFLYNEFKFMQFEHIDISKKSFINKCLCNWLVDYYFLTKSLFLMNEFYVRRSML